MIVSAAFDPSWWTDKAQAPIANALLTFLAMGMLALASMWLKHWVCRRDEYMKRSKPLIEELYSIAAGVVALCIVTGVQFLLLGEVVAATPGEIIVHTGKLSLVGKLSALTTISVAVMVVMASIRTRIARLDLTVAMDTSGELIPPDLETAMPRTKKVIILGIALSFLFLEFYLVANVFSSNVQLLRY